MWRKINDVVIDNDLVYSIYKSGLAIYNMQAGFPSMDTLSMIPLIHEYEHGLKIINELMLYNSNGRVGFVYLQDPRNPRIVAESDLGTGFFDLAYRSLNLYLACGYEGVKILDLGNREMPMPKTILREPAHAVAVWIYEDYLYAIDDFNGIFIYDISRDLTSPVFVGKKLFSNQLKDMVTIGDKAYCANTDGGLVVMDMTDPENPEIIHDYPTSTFINHVNISGGYVFASDAYGNFEIYSPDTLPRLAYIERKSLVTIPRIIIENNIKSLLAVDTGSVARIYGISGRWHLEEIASYGEGSEFTGFAFADSTAYIASMTDPLISTKILSGNANALADSYPARCERIKSYNGYLYMADNVNKQIWITKLSPKSAPTTVNLIPYEGDATRVDVSENTNGNLIVALFRRDAVLLFELDPENMTIIRQEAMTGFDLISTGMLYNNYLYIAEGVDLRIYELVDIAVPEYLEEDLWPGKIDHLEIANGLLYSSGEFGFNINELLAFQPGVLLDSYQSDIELFDFVIAKEAAFCSAGNGGIFALRLPADSSVSLQGIYETPGFINHVDILDSNLIVSDSYGILSYYISLSGQFPTQQKSPIPRIFEVGQNFPNPFNQQTVIPVDIPASGNNLRLEIAIYNILGRKVSVIANEVVVPGHYFFKWDGKNGNGDEVSSGIYLYRTRLGGIEVSRKMLLVK